MIWRTWFTPRAPDPLTASRETAIRLLLPLILLIRGGLLIGTGSTSVPTLFIPSLVLFIVLSIVSFAALIRGRISLSAVALLLLLVHGDIVSMALGGYWDNRIISLTILNTILASAILTAPLLDLYVFGIILVYPLAMFVLHLTHTPPAPQVDPWWWHALTLIISVLSGWFVLRYLKHQLERYITGQQELVASLRRENEEREHAEIALRASEERFRLISSVTSDYTFSSRFNEQGELKHLLLTGAFETISGYTPEEYQAAGGWWATLYPEDREQDARDMAALRQNQRVVTEVRTIRKDGGVRWVRVYAHPVWDAERSCLVGINGGVQDITEQKRLEATLHDHTIQLEKLVEERTNALRQANEQLELVLNHTANALAFADANGNVLVSNTAFREAFVEKGAQSIEFILWSLTDEEQVATVGDALLKVIQETKSQQLEARIVSQDGVERDLELSLIPVQTMSDGRKGILLSGHDITHLKELERFKARFIADAVHDLATPITGLNTRLYLLQRSPERLTEHVRALENQVQHLRSLVEDMRTLSQIDRGKLSLDIERVDLNSVLQRVYDSYQPVALDKKQKLILNLASDIPQIGIDIRQIERILVNLVTNAINFTPEDKAISMYTRRDGPEVIVCVTDEGVGINPEDLAHVFERFYRTADARRRLSAGTGLGLAITKEIVEMHGGSVSVASEPEHGSTFTIRLPLPS